MTSRAFLIRGISDYYAPVGDVPVELGPLVKDALGAPVRRIGRFVQLALIGAARCLAGKTPPTETGVYLTSGRGDMEVQSDVMNQLYRDGVPPRPLSFINTVSNSACFYVAKQFGLKGRSAFVCNRYFSFESALQLAMLDFEMGVTSSALVGSVDIAPGAPEVHRKRLRLAPDAPIAEGSHWIWLEADDAGAPGPRVLSIETLPDADGLRRWMATHAGDVLKTLIAFGQFIDPAEAPMLVPFEKSLVFDYCDGRAYYDSQSGAAIAAFLAARPAGIDTLLHVNRDAEGRFAAFAVRA